MSLATIAADLRNVPADFLAEASHLADEFRTKLEAHATELEHALTDAATAAQSPIAASIAAAVHVPPAALSKVAELIDELEARFAEYAAAGADSPAEPAPEATPAEPVTAAPVVGGTAS